MRDPFGVTGIDGVGRWRYRSRVITKGVENGCTSSAVAYLKETMV